MTISQDAFRVLGLLAGLDYGESATGVAIASSLDMAAGRVNEAALLLESNAYIELDRRLGTDPFEFLDASVTPRGRHEYELAAPSGRLIIGSDHAAVPDPFAGLMLEPQQMELLRTMVEASRKLPNERREKFMVAGLSGGDLLHHQGLGNVPVFMGDIEALSDEGLLRVTYGSKGSPMVDITPRGYAYYRQLAAQAGLPTAQVESDIQAYIRSDTFRTRYQAASEKWELATEKLWGADSQNELTVIGHLCREAMQAFATGLIEQFKPSSYDTNTQHDVNRIRAVVETQKLTLSSSAADAADALVQYWATVSTLAQRQEHGAQRESEPLNWEDARRLVFQTLFVMHELSRLLS